MLHSLAEVLRLEHTRVMLQGHVAGTSSLVCTALVHVAETVSKPVHMKQTEV